MTLGMPPEAARRESSPSVTPASGSVWSPSVKGNRQPALRFSVLEGCPNLWLNSPRLPPAMWGMTPSNTVLSASSRLRARYRKSRRKRPLWEAPNPWA